MYLSVKPNPRVDAATLAAHITQQIIDDTTANGDEFPTWESMEVTLTDDTKISGFKNSGQLEGIGWTRMRSSRGLIKVTFVQNTQTAEATGDQKAMLLCRFANMLRNHFGRHIDTISLLDL